MKLDWPSIAETPHNLTGFICPCCELHWQKILSYVTPIGSIGDIIGECKGNF